MEIYRVAFFGHRDTLDLLKIEESISTIIKELLQNNSYVEFYIGRNGNFDIFVASVIKRIQRDLSSQNSSLILVLPYRVADIESLENYYDEILIFESKKSVHPKAAITLRNRFTVELADLIITNVIRESGGAFAAVKYAEKNGKKIINISNSESTLGDCKKSY